MTLIRSHCIEHDNLQTLHQSVKLCYRAIHEKAGLTRELAVLSKIQLLFQLLGTSLVPEQGGNSIEKNLA